MATPTITNPEGIDVPIQKLQNRFTNNLWTGVRADDATKNKVYNSYGRAVIVEGVPKVFNPAAVNNGYYELLMNDRASAQSFFIVNDNNKVGFDEFEADVSLYFMVNLEHLSSLSTRAEQEVINDVRSYLRNEPYGFELTAIVSGDESVSDFDQVKVKDNLQPYFCFRFDMTLKYQYLC